ncbi:hypothetical protein OG979_30270 [Actinomadura citrea]|uniref:hypothetical protein n=1 Tax=Actinomadura citrea TaxID=46158 RepID=UPI002E2D93D6|nr:hypothetical protein [Actinomadura citrea]
MSRTITTKSDGEFRIEVSSDRPVAGLNSETASEVVARALTDAGISDATVDPKMTVTQKDGGVTIVATGEKPNS